MIYNGEFRSIDTTNDSNGQLYKVVINTDLHKDGYYPWTEDLPLMGKTPKTPIILEMADDPFVVGYEGDSNIYKPYKCSTATARFMLPTLQRDFICTNKNDIGVMLLKWKNEVEDKGNYMLNTITNARLDKKSYGNPDMNPWRGFVPKEYDEFCYTVEWIGFVTPNTYSQDYNNILEPFELECQDALSTLKYFDYKVDIKNTRSFLDTIIQCLSQIDSVYKHIYITKSIVIKPTDIRHALEKLMCLDDNWFNEDNEPMNCLDVIFQIMQYVNCTIIPCKDNLYITNYDAIASNQHNYKIFKRVPENDIVIPQQNTVTWEGAGTAYLGSRFNIDGLNLAGNNTQISTTSTYKKVVLKTDEYYKDSLIPNIDDDEQVEKIDEFDGAELVYENTKHLGGAKYDRVTRSAKDAGILLRVKNDIGNGTIETITYNRDRAVDNEGTTGKHIFIDTTVIDNPTLWSEFKFTNSCAPIEYGSLLLPEVSSQYLNELFRSYDGNRAFIFHTPAVLWGQLNPPTPGEPGTDRYWDLALYEGNLYFGSTTNFQPPLIQPMLKITSRPTFFKACDANKKTGQFINISGDWTFYNSYPHSVPVKGGWNTEVNKNLLAEAHHMYSWVKICLTNTVTGQKMWVKSVNSNTGAHYEYQWSTTEQWCKLFYGGKGYNNVKYQKKRKGLGSTVYTLCAESDAFETDFSIIKNNFGVDGTIIPVPQQMGDFYGTVSIEFNRPVGCGYENDIIGSRVYFACCSVLSNFDMNIVDYCETEYYGGEELSDSNGEYEIKMNDFATDEFPTITSDLSSGYKKSTNLSNVYVNFNGKNERVESIANNGCGVNALPEKVIVNAISETYKDAKLLLDILVKNSDLGDYMIDSYIWDTQFKDTQFVSNSLSINYEMNKVALSLMEKPSLLSKSTKYRNTTRNFRRNNDNLFNPVPRKNEVVLDDPPQPTLSTNMDIRRDNRSIVVDDGRIGPGNPSSTAGLIKDSIVGVDFSTGHAFIAHPNNMTITSEIDTNNELKINYSK